jgi:hypothetical protein
MEKYTRLWPGARKLYIWKSDWHGWVITASPRVDGEDGPNYLWGFTEGTWRAALETCAMRQRNMVRRAMGIS